MVAGSIPASAHNDEERVGVMKNVRKQIRINTLHHALTTRLCFRAVYRLSRSVNDGIDESAYVIVLKKAGAVQVSFVRYRRWNVIHVHVDGGVGAFYAGSIGRGMLISFTSTGSTRNSRRMTLHGPDGRQKSVLCRWR